MNCAFSVLADVLLRACRLQRGRLHVKCGRGRWHVKCGIMAAHRTDTPCAAAEHAASALSGGCLTQALHGTITVAVAPGGGVHLNVNGLETDAKLKDALMPGRDTTNNRRSCLVTAWLQLCQTAGHHLLQLAFLQHHAGVGGRAVQQNCRCKARRELCHAGELPRLLLLLPPFRHRCACAPSPDLRIGAGHIWRSKHASFRAGDKSNSNAQQHFQGRCPLRPQCLRRALPCHVHWAVLHSGATSECPINRCSMHLVATPQIGRQGPFPAAELKR